MMCTSTLSVNRTDGCTNQYLLSYRNKRRLSYVYSFVLLKCSMFLQHLLSFLPAAINETGEYGLCSYKARRPQPKFMFDSDVKQHSQQGKVTGPVLSWRRISRTLLDRPSNAWLCPSAKQSPLCIQRGLCFDFNMHYSVFWFSAFYR